MRIWILAAALVAPTVFAAPSSMVGQSSEETRHQLQQRLSAVDTLQSSFIQRVYDENEQLQEELEGTLVLQRPHFLRWETHFPDDSVMVADGEAVWYYNAFVEQLSIFDQAQDLEQNPMLVLLSNDQASWNTFAVHRDSDYWVVQEQDNEYAQVSLSIAFGDNSRGETVIERLRLDDGQGQVSVFELSEVIVNQPLDPQLFTFQPPQGVELDDQRSGR